MKQPLAFIIEDHPMLSNLFEEALIEAGYDTETVLDGRVAAARLQEIVPHLVLLDLHLPYVSGGDLVIQIRKDPRLEKTRVIIASADGTWSNQLDYEADFVLNKPVSYVQLRDLAARLLKTFVVA
ncbi:MAG: response regulator [Chloroflexota bacterium]